MNRGYKLSNNTNTSLWSEQQLDLADDFKALFFGDGAQLSIVNDENKPQAVTPELLDLAILSHLWGTPFRYQTNKDGKPIGYKKTRSGLLLGVSPIDSNNNCRWVGIDLDGKGHKNGALLDVEKIKDQILDKARSLGLYAYWEISKGGNGRHVWIFFKKPISSFEARSLGLFLCPFDAPLQEPGLYANPLKHKAIEVFPKQTEKSLGGNPIWLPGWCGALENRCRLFGFDGSEVPFSFVRQNEDNADRSLKESSAIEQARINALIRTNTERRNLAASIHVRGYEIKPGEAHPDAIADVEKHCRAIVNADGRVGVIGRFFAIASWVLGGFIGEDLARETLIDACSRNSSAARWPLADRLRWWRNALQGAEPKISWLSDMYLSQIKKAQDKEKTLDRKPNEEQRAAVKTIVEDYLTGSKTGVGVVAADPGIGKTTAISSLKKSLPIIGNRAVVLAVPTHDAARDAYKIALENGVDAARYFSPASDQGLLENGERVCKKSLDMIAQERARGIHGKDHCRHCIYAKDSEGNDCKATKGYEGSDKPRLIICTHEGLRAIKKKAFFVIDELTSPFKNVTCTKKDFKDLASGLGNFYQDTTTTLRDAARALLNGEVLDDAALSKMAVNENGKAPVKASLTLANPTEHLGAWRAATWLLSRYKVPSSLPPIKDINYAFEYVVAAQTALKLRCGYGLALNGHITEHFANDLALASGARVTVERLAVKSNVVHETIWRPTVTASRSYLLPYGELDAAQLSTFLDRILKDLTARPQLQRVLLASHKPVIDALAGALGEPLRALLGSRGGCVSCVYWGGSKTKGSNDFIGFDAAYTIGDPMSGAKPHIAEFDPNEEWERSTGNASTEIAQFFARLRFNVSEKPLRMVHTGLVFPDGWVGSETPIEYVQPGSKDRGSIVPVGWLAKLKTILEPVGAYRALLRDSGICSDSLTKILKGKTVPKRDFLEFVIRKYEEIQLVKSDLLAPEKEKLQDSSLPLLQLTDQQKAPTVKDFARAEISTPTDRYVSTLLARILRMPKPDLAAMSPADRERAEIIDRAFARVASS